ncbi:MAG: hypothetical protein AAGJ83_01615 [Planctomycetota bacterium]
MNALLMTLAIVAAPANQLTAPKSGSSFRGLACSGDVICVAGNGPEVWISEDSGLTWKNRTPQETNVTDYRCVAIPSGDDPNRPTILLASAGSPAVILRSTDRGLHWTRVYENEHPSAFLDALRFWDQNHGLAFGDPIDGRFLILATQDGGRSWRPCPCEIAAIEGEAGFAASNGSITLAQPATAMIGLGGRKDGGPSRVLRTSDAGRTWAVSEVPPIPAGPSSGVFAIDLRSDGVGIAVGGTYEQTENPAGNIAVTRDAGRTWAVPTDRPPGYRSSIVSVVDKNGKNSAWVVTGPSGTDLSFDGQRWQPLGQSGFHSLRPRGDGTIVACGSEGRMTVLRPFEIQ